jgi:hypothetical protein
MLAETETMTMTTMMAAAGAMKTTAVTAVVWVVACPCFFVKLAHRGAPNNWLTTAKWG